MELVPLTPEQWGDGGNAIKLLWLSLLFAATGGVSFIIAHAMIPSAVDSGTIPPGFRKIRLPLYFAGFLAVAGIAINVALMIGFLGYIEDVFPRRFL